MAEELRTVGVYGLLVDGRATSLEGTRGATLIRSTPTGATVIIPSIARVALVRPQAITSGLISAVKSRILIGRSAITLGQRMATLGRLLVGGATKVFLIRGANGGHGTTFVYKERSRACGLITTYGLRRGSSRGPSLGRPRETLAVEGVGLAPPRASPPAGTGSFFFITSAALGNQLLRRSRKTRNLT